MKHSVTHRFALPLVALVAALLTASFLAVGCDATGTKPLPPVGLDSVRVEPRPVVVGDTATFTAVLEEDALNSVSQLKFGWFNTNNSRSFNIKDNELHWPDPRFVRAPRGTTTVEFAVTANLDDEADDYTDARETRMQFKAKVVEIRK